MAHLARRRTHSAMAGVPTKLRVRRTEEDDPTRSFQEGARTRGAVETGRVSNERQLITENVNWLSPLPSC
jgi:hypothetical protein